MNKQNLISLTVLSLIVLNIPSFLLRTTSVSISSPISYLLFILLFILILLNKISYTNNVKLLFVMSLLYFIIGLFNYSGLLSIYLINFTKYFIFLFGLYIAVRHLNYRLLLFLLFIGGFMILLDSLYFRFNDIYKYRHLHEYGRYAGLYLNPNIAGFVTIIGYCISLTQLKKTKLFFLLYFTLLGLMTLSKTFIISWLFINFIYFLFNRRHSIYILLILFFIPILFSFANILNLDFFRINLLVDLYANGYNNYDILLIDSRTDTWALYYSKIFDAPLLGNGYSSFQGNSLESSAGVHNSFLLIFGESGIFPFILLLILFASLFYRTYNIFKKDITPFLLTFILLIQFLVSHNFFTSGLLILLLLFIIHKIDNLSKFNNDF